MDKNEMAGADAGNARLSLRSIGSLFSDSWDLYKERWQVLVEIVLLPTLVVALGYILLYLGFPFSILGGLIVFIGYIIFVFSMLPVIFSLHHTAGVDASYKATIGWFWPFVWVTILEILAVMGGSIMLIIPGIWLGVALMLMMYVFVIEHRRGVDALRQSKDYIKGYWWAVLGRVLLLGLIFLAATIIIEIPVTIIVGNAARVLVTMVLTLFFVPFSVIYHYVIFENLRALKPELADAQTKRGTGFIKTSAIVGIVIPVLAVCALIIALGFGVFYSMRHIDRYASPPGYGMQVPSR
ncbi:MAG: hypothetical protein ABR884_03980 [Minisyncoccia bacterium]|jgi:hypothetical protein